MKTSLPSKYQIAQYWQNNTSYRFVPGIGEPSCFSCKYFRKEWDAYKTLAQRWNKSTLQRAHILPKSHGGPNSADNLVLLCVWCHDRAPMTSSRESMLDWVKKPKYTAQESRIAEALNTVCKELNINIEQFNVCEEVFRKALEDLGIGVHFQDHEGAIITTGTYEELFKHIYETNIHNK